MGVAPQVEMLKFLQAMSSSDDRILFLLAPPPGLPIRIVEAEGLRLLEGDGRPAMVVGAVAADGIG